MPLTLVQTIAPVLPAVQLADVKRNSNIEYTDDDSYIENILVPACSQYMELELRRQLITSTWTRTLESFCELSQPVASQYVSYGSNSSSSIILPRTPVASVVSIEYYDTAGVLQALDSSLYQVDLRSEPARVKPAPNLTWPATQSDRFDAVTITFTAGYGLDSTTIPLELYRAMLVIIGGWYENREAMSESTLKVVPVGIENHIQHWKVPTIW